MYKVPRPSSEEVRAFLKEAWGKPLSIDTETTGLLVRDGRDYAIGISIAFKVGPTIKAHYFPFRHVGGGNYSQQELADIQVLLDRCPCAVFHNAKFDLYSLSTLGIRFKARWYDTAIMAYLINENQPRDKSLNSCLKYYIGAHAQKAKSVELDAVIKAYGWGMVPASLMRKYATMDAYLTLQLFDALWPMWQEEKLDKFWWDQKQPLVEVVRAMETRGVKLDIPYCKRMSELAANEMEDYRDMLGSLNPTSHKSQYDHLVKVLGIPEYQVEKKRKVVDEYGNSGYESYYAVTFDAASYVEHWAPWLERLSEPLASYVLAYRGWQKADSAFYRSYLKHVSPDGRIRPSYKHHKDETDGGTITGRLSCAEPNLQQIPKSSTKPWNGGVKRAFIPSNGYELWEVDYSQLELRLGTAYGEVPELIEVFADPNRDIFSEIAPTIGLPRQQTKTFVYSTQYGAGIKRLVSALGFTPEQAAKVREDYYRAYPGFREISEKIKNIVLSKRKVELWSGRFRHFSNPRAEAHKAFNSVIQGGAADIVERKMIELYYKIDQQSSDEVRMLLQVHDSVIFEIKQGTADTWVPKISELMSDVNSLRSEGFGVQFAVDAHPLHENYKGDQNG